MTRSGLEEDSSKPDWRKTISFIIYAVDSQKIRMWQAALISNYFLSQKKKKKMKSFH